MQKDVPEKVKYIYNTKNIDKTLTIAESGLLPESEIQVVETKHVKGAKIHYIK